MTQRAAIRARSDFVVDVTQAGVRMMGAVEPQPLFGSIDVGITVPAADVPPTPEGLSVPTSSLPPASPSAMQMAASFARSVGQFASGGFRTVSKERHAERIAQCKPCENLSGTRCVLCGCFVNAKAWMPHETCPIGKWPA